MGLSILILTFALGMAAGWLGRDSARAQRHIRNLIPWGTRILLFSMGAKFALDRALFLKTPKLFVMAAASALLLSAIFFGIFLLWNLLRGHGLLAGKDALATADGKSSALLPVVINTGCIALGFLSCFLLGPHAARMPVNPLVEWILYFLMLLIGFDLGSELHRLDIRQLPVPMLLAPGLNILMSLGVGMLFGVLTQQGAREGMLIHAGLGWYSLSSVLLAERGLEILAVLTFIHNVCRELLSILTAPVAARIHPYLPVFLGGATSMDVMLPFVQRHCGRQYTLAAFYSGLVCSLAVIPLVRGITGA